MSELDAAEADLMTALHAEIRAMRVAQRWTTIVMLSGVPAAVLALAFMKVRTDAFGYAFLATWALATTATWGRFAAERAYFRAAERVRAAHLALAGRYNDALRALLNEVDDG